MIDVLGESLVFQVADLVNWEAQRCGGLYQQANN